MEAILFLVLLDPPPPPCFNGLMVVLQFRKSGAVLAFSMALSITVFTLHTGHFLVGRAPQFGRPFFDTVETRYFEVPREIAKSSK